MTWDAQQVTVAALLFGIGAAGLKKLWVWGWAYAQLQADLAKMEKDRDFWRDTALRSMGHTDKALEVAAQSGRDG